MWTVRSVTLLCAASLLLACENNESSEPQPRREVQAPTWEDGARYVYSIELSSDVVLAGSKMLGFSLQGDVVLHVRDKPPRSVEFASTLPSAKFDSPDADTKAQFEVVAGQMRRPFLFTLDEGRLSQVRVEPQWSRFSDSISRTIAAALQFPIPKEDRKTESWTTHEEDATGKYEATYKLLDPEASGHQRFAKEKLSYEKIAIGKLGSTNFRANLAPRVLDSKGTLAFEPVSGDHNDNAVRLERISYNEKLQTSLTETSPMVTSTKLKLRLKHRERPERAFNWASALITTKALSPSQHRVTPKSSVNYDDARIGDYTFDSALAELEKSASDPKSRPRSPRVGDEPLPADDRAEQEAELTRQGRVFGAMAAILRNQPKTIPRAVATIERGSPAQLALLDALSSAGSAEAQRALIGIMENERHDGKLRSAAAFALIRTPHATAYSIATLEKHAVKGDMLRVHALYGLGTFCRRLAEVGDQRRADKIIQTLIDALGRAESDTARVHVLRGIANSGHTAAFATVRPLLDSRSSKLSAGAVDAIRLMKHPQVDGIIAEKLASSEDAVLTAALYAVSVREPSETLAAALERIARTADRAAPRLKAVKIMGQWLPQRAELRATLQHLAQNDARDQIRRAARQALGS